MKPAFHLLFCIALSFGLEAQCLAPTNFIASNVSTSSIDIDLSASGTGPWEVEYGLMGFILGTGTTQISNANIFTLSNLSPATSYRVFVRRKCGSQTSPSSYFVFTTQCGNTLSAPISFNFEGALWQSPTAPSATGSVGTCWIVSPQGTKTFWATGPPHDTRLNTGPEGDHTTGFGNFIHLNGLSTSLDTVSHIQSPAINLLGLSNPQLKFWYHLYGANIDSMVVLIKSSVGIDWDTLHTFYGPQQMAQDEAWQSINLPLNGYVDSIINLQFSGYGKGIEVQMAIDDLSIYDVPSCLHSSYFRNVSNDDSSVLLDWDPGSGTNFEIEYGPRGFSIGNGILVNASAPPFRISNLLPNSGYTFYLRDDCGSNQYSSRSLPLEVNTDCIVEYAPLYEDFEGSSWPNGGLDPCWDRYIYDDFKWNIGPPPLSYSQSGPGSNHHSSGSSHFLVANRPNQNGKARSSITSPLIDLDSIVKPMLNFWTHMFGLQITAFDIAIDSGDGFILLKRIVGSQHNSKTEDWLEQIIPLYDYTGKRVKIKFTAIASSNWSSLARIAIDDLSIGEAPACPKPTNLQVNNLTYNSANINWQSGGATNWLMKVQPTGSFSTISSVGSNPHILNQLQPGTEYTVWVKDSCGISQTSDWSAALSFKTYCLPDTSPYFEDFEGSQFVVQNSWFSTGTLDPCWSRSHEVGPIWQPSPATLIPNNLLPSSDHTTGSGKYMGGSLFLANGTNEPTSFTSPRIDISNLSRPELSFWYYLGGYSFSTNQIQVEVNNGSGWQNVSTILGPKQLSTSAAWLNQVVPLSSFRGDTIQLRFITIGNNLYSATAGGIDDISIYNNPNCLAPSNLEALSVGINDASLKWTTGGATNWMVKYRPFGGNSQIKKTAVNDSYALTGLLPGKRYEIWVRDSCGADVSPWHGPIYIWTDCHVNSVPYYESFDSPLWLQSPNLTKAGNIDDCWRRSDSLSKVWMPASGASAGALSGPSNSRGGSGKYLMTEYLTNPAQSSMGPTELSSPLIANIGLQQPELNFWYHMHGPQIQKLQVYLQKNDARILIDSLQGQQQSSKSSPWQQGSISLSAFIGDTFKIVFVGRVGNNQGRINIAIDDVEIIDRLCTGPSNLSASSITFSSAFLSWSASSNNSTIEYGLAGFNQGSGTQISGLSSTYALSGLQPFTSYEFYVRDSCRNSNSNWVGPFSFTTGCSASQANFNHQGSLLNLSFDASTSLGIGLHYNWDFGDGNTGTGLNPNHSYATPGTYNVQLIITDTCGLSDTLIKTIQICSEPEAVINYSINGLTVNFSGLASTGALHYYWDLGPAGIYTSDSLQATFPAKGSYRILLVVTNACGMRDSSYFRLLICDKPIASFTTSISSLNNLLFVNFDGTASSYADSYIWDFGDGSTDTTTLSPNHIYPSTGQSFMVKLIVKADCGLSDTMTFQIGGVISIEEAALPQMAVFPNPAEDRLSVLSTKTIRPEELLWYDSQGRRLQIPFIDGDQNRLEFDVSRLAQGEYFLVLNSSPIQSISFIVR